MARTAQIIPFPGIKLKKKDRCLIKLIRENTDCCIGMSDADIMKWLDSPAFQTPEQMKRSMHDVYRADLSGPPLTE